MDGPPRPLENLASELVTAQCLRRVARHAQLGTMLPAVMEELSQHGALAAGTKLPEHAISRVDQSHPGADEVIGTLHLRAAIIPGRSGQAGRAWSHYGV